ncbi:unnamed protein product [Microthlaspi erraticum]|uniref:Uncharacterized protein n=1 Tax=Microthlaspi erraticum TaxID=1685480 RepID=A0A6D2J6B7_9BRAS|nr:unnamed protein product [Microthlaspi erraticum]
MNQKLHKTNQNSIELRELTKLVQSASLNLLVRRRTLHSCHHHTNSLYLSQEGSRNNYWKHKTKFDELMKEIELKLPFIDALDAHSTYQKVPEGCCTSKDKEVQGMVV